LNRDKFLKFLERFYGTIVGLNSSKGREYSYDEDTHSNFKEAAEGIKVRCPECGAVHPLTPLAVMAVYMHKQFSAMKSYIWRGRALSDETPFSRAVDLGLYAALFAALVEEDVIEEEVPDVL
jgi:hypothetical protein